MPHQLQKLTANLVVSSVERSLAFYRDVLGFSVTATVPDAAPYVFAWVESGAVSVMLNAREAAEQEYPAFAGRPIGVDGFEFEGIRFLQNGIVSLAVVPAGAGEVVLIDGGTGEIKAIACAHSGVLTNGITALATFAEALP